MSISINQDLLWIMGVAFAVWLLLSFIMVPSARRTLLSPEQKDVSGAAAWLAGLSVLRTVVSAVIIAGAIVVGASAGLEHHLQSLSSNTDKLQEVVAIRDWSERTIDAVNALSTEAWIGALALLALIWFIAARSRSRRRWDGALEARRNALSTALEGLERPALQERAEAADKSAVEALDSELRKSHSDNEVAIARVLATPVLKFGDDGPEASIADLKGIMASMLTRATALEAGEVTPESGDEMNAMELRQAASRMEEQVDVVKSEVQVELKTGTTPITISLEAAENWLEGDDYLHNEIYSGRSARLREIIVSTQLSAHSAQGASKARREPEIFREWVAAGAGGTGVVKAAGFTGRIGGWLMLITLFLGLLSLGAREIGPTLVTSVKAMEIDFAKRVSDHGVKTVVGQRKSDPVDPSEDLASDEATAAQLRHAFRSSIARSMQARFPAGRALGAQQRFDLGAVEARRRILTASNRPAAPSVLTGRSTQAIQARVPPPSASAKAAADVFDDALERRIETLRRNETAWTRLRRSAALRPLSPNLVADEFFRTAFTNERLASSHAMRVWAERTSGNFARVAAATGEIPTRVAYTADFMPHHSPAMTARDRRLVADFRENAPQRLSHAANNVRSGSIDPGSLHRVAPARASVPGQYASARPAAAGVYQKLFPSGGVASSGPTRVVSRSYMRIRFSGRVGGVVIGRPPAKGGKAPDIVGLSWKFDGQKLWVKLTDRNGKATTLGPFHPAITHHAMAYAADGRVVTSTLPHPQTNAASEDGFNPRTRRVVVHPAFEDTAFACAAIQVDRFVDTFSLGQNVSDELKMAGFSRQSVASLGQILRLSAIPEFYLSPTQAAAIKAQLQKFEGTVALYAKACGTGASCFPMKTYAKFGMRYGAAQSYVECLRNSRLPQTCLGQLRVSNSGLSYLVDSGVREVEYKLDPELNFLTGQNSRSDPLWPLNFMVQAMPQDNRGEDVDIGEDWKPWTFPGVEEEIRQAVINGIRTSPEASEVLRQMRQFVILQRLFRLALDGNLGVDFPLSALVGLQKKTQPFVEIRRHERWNYDQNWADAVIAEQRKIVSALGTIETTAPESSACERTIKNAVTAHRDTPWPRGDGVWGEIEKVTEACADHSKMYSLRSAMGEAAKHDLVNEALHYVRSKSRPKKPFLCEPLN
ncbi:MAG: hypothetical protein K0U74_12565 [Alphaproteobacteria bacterium]|nr:hypothetical protein [Alphaproteobacteria bacterium]